jgi:hypothetical protein
MTAASAYLTLLEDWPQHARAVNASDLEAIRSRGAALREGLAAISVDPATGGPAPLLDRALGYYRYQLDALVEEADSLARRHRQQSLLRMDPASLFVRMEDGEGAGAPLDVPSFVASSLPQQLRTAAVLGVDDITIVYRIEPVDSVSKSDTRHSFLFFGKRHDRFTHSRIRVTLEVRSREMGTIGAYRAQSPYVLARVEEMNGDHGSEDVRERTDHVEDVPTYFATSWWPEVATDSAQWARELVGPQIVEALETRIEEELRRHATAGLEGVFDAICAPELRAGTLSAPDLSSATRMRSSLTGLSSGRSLVEAYVRLAFPDALESRTLVRDAVLGENAILDRTSLCTVVASGASGLRRVWLDEEPRRRLELLRAGVHEQLEASSSPSGVTTLVDELLERLDAAIRVQWLRARVARTG